MGPKNKFQKEIWDLKNMVLEIPVKKITEFTANCVRDHIGFRLKKGVNCMECGKFFPFSHKIEATEVECPHCKRKLTLKVSRKLKFSQTKHVAVLDVVGDFQVVRTFEVWSHHRVGGKPVILGSEIHQHWIKSEYQYDVLAQKRNMMGGYCWGEIEFRTKNKYSYYDPYRESIDAVYPQYIVKDEYVKLGFKGDMHFANPVQYFVGILTNNLAECLQKMGQSDLFLTEISNARNVGKYWQQIKIANRHGYKVAKAITWLDYIDMMAELGIDYNNPKFLCPDDLNLAHNRLVRKLDALRRKKELEKQKAEMETAQRDYEEAKKAFFGLQFKNNKIRVKVLESVQEFLEQSEIHKHCVFTNKYYYKDKSLVMAAYVGDVPVETIEVSLDSFEVVQSRGWCNGPSEFNKEIVSLVQQNMDKIRGICKKKIRGVA